VKKIGLVLVAVLLTAGFLARTVVWAGESDKGERKRLEGTVKVEKEGDKVVQVTLGEGDAKVTVFTLSGEGKKLLDLDGKKVKAVGRLVDVGGKKVLQVTAFQEVK